MRKYIYLLLFLMSMFCFSSCAAGNMIEETTSVTQIDDNITAEIQNDYYNTFENFESTFTNVDVSESNYVIKSSEEYAGNFYEIYDNNGDLLDRGFHDFGGSFNISKEDDIVTLEYGLGGTNVQPKYRFYDIEKSKVSRYFSGPIATTEELVAYFSVVDDKAKLVVQDAFDIDKIYKEFTGQFDKFIFMNIRDIYFSKDGTKISIKYCETNNESNIIEETFDIN